MKTRIDHLKNYLVETAKLETEQLRIYAEEGEATAEFHSEEQFLLEGGQLEKTDSLERFHMVNKYQLSVHVSSYAGDIDALIRLMLWWLNDQYQGITLKYVLEANNNDTNDIWFDMAVSEGSRNEDGGVHTC
ncbi:hypothetical protein EOL70_13445 [Leucothrix sargassi]|nr:hypothetical protein EOL70_13445 [Leucothrix sargassi]